MLGGMALLLIYNYYNTDNEGAHSTPIKNEQDGLTDIAPSYCSYAYLFVKGKLPASYYTDMITDPRAVLVLVRASPDIDLNSNTSPFILYDSKFCAMLDNHGNIASFPGLIYKLMYENYPGVELVIISPINSLCVMTVFCF